MEIESSRGWRAFWLIGGFAFAGFFVMVVIFATLQSGFSPLTIVASLFPIGIGIFTSVWMGRPAWIRVGTSDISCVPPLGSSKVFPRSSVRWIVRVPGAKGSSSMEFRDQENRNLVVIEQRFAKEDIEKLAQLLNAKFTWELDWKNAVPPAGNPS